MPEWRKRAVRIRRPAPRGLLKRRGPVSRNWGFDRGTPVDRYFIERFLASQSEVIRGPVLEVKGDEYTRRYGSSVTSCDVLDVDADNPRATVVADLTNAPGIPDSSYDCIVLTQVLHLIAEIDDAVAECHRILRPGGTLLATVPTLSRMSRELFDTDHWRMTPVGAQKVFSSVFGRDRVVVTGHGNAVLCAAFLMGIAVEEMSAALLESSDPFFPLVVTVRGTKAT